MHTTGGVVASNPGPRRSVKNAVVYSVLCQTSADLLWARLQAVLGGNSSPSKSDIKKILDSGV